MARSLDTKAMLYRLTGDGYKVEFKSPGDTAALSKATNILLYSAGDDRPGEEAPVGDYLLARVGPAVAEPYMRFRKHIGTAGRRSGSTLLSWEDA